MIKKVILSAIGTAIVALALMSGQQTLARWSDAERVPGGDIRSGTLDLTVGDDATQASDYQFSALGRVDLAPGQFVQAPLVIRNAGDSPLTFRLERVTQSNAELPLTVNVTLISDVAACPASGTPTGEVLLPDTPATDAQVPAAPAARTLSVGAQEIWCFRATVGVSAPPSTDSTLTFGFRADQT
ncbi:hypothetical protein GCM10009624_05430 [Gordonia sinesedis]